jgi:ceramide glucosyltransferase
MICDPLLGANAKVSKLIQLEQEAKHELLIISDADVQVAPDFLENLISPLLVSQKQQTPTLGNSGHTEEKSCGLVNCFYRLKNPTTVAMQWEAICINADFWSQVLQSRSLKRLDFALGAVMATHRARLKEIGGFTVLADCLADDYQLGHRIARLGYKIELSTVVADCLAPPMDWRKVWTHQLRWARTIRVCQPAPYFFSILGNPTLWPLVWLLVHLTPLTAGIGIGSSVLRIIGALDLQQRLTQSRKHFPYWWLAPVKDLLQTVLWLLAFTGNHMEWRGQRLRLRWDGTLEKNRTGVT